MEKVIARRPGQYLIQTGPDRGRILDARGYHEPMFLQSLLARGYWEDADISLDEAKRQTSRMEREPAKSLRTDLGSDGVPPVLAQTRVASPQRVVSPVVYPLTVSATGKRVVFRIWDDAAKTTPTNLVGATAMAAVHDAKSGTVVMQLECAVIEPQSIEVNTSTTVRIPAGAWWDLRVTFPTGTVQTVVMGPVT